MKHRLENDDHYGDGPAGKHRVLDTKVRQHFRTGLFATDVQNEYAQAYSASEPYKHGVIPNLLDPQLLRQVRKEIETTLSFTPKETDIYKIHQSGDLANLDGLEDSSLKLLPSLVTLRNALYSAAFREYIATVANSGPLSGTRTDMAVNVYTPGCHLLCHDDVIGSRRVSYILYLTDPDNPWEPSWGGALRLYPTESVRGVSGSDLETRLPLPDFSVVIPPAFNQLAFFAVQPGLSFHDVEEVYAAAQDDVTKDSARVRLAISGWYHIPQAGEDGYEEGAEEAAAEKSSLAQLQGKLDIYDLPQPQWQSFETSEASEEDIEFTERDLELLVRFLNPTYLTPDTLEELSANFQETYSLRLASFLSPKIESSLKDSLTQADGKSSNTNWSVARPPHKHRYLFQRPNTAAETDETPLLTSLLNELFPSQSFKKWLAVATGLKFTECNILARRFRRGQDYTLATEYDDDEPQLEVCLGLTPSIDTCWGADDLDEDDESAGVAPRTNGKSRVQPTPSRDDTAAPEDQATIGGYEIYMAADDDEDVEVEANGDKHEVILPSSSSHTGAGKRRQHADPAIYRTTGADDDSVVFTMPACWNTMSIVLRDKGILSFVKYVSRSAPGDRWDICGEWKVSPEDDLEDE